MLVSREINYALTAMKLTVPCGLVDLTEVREVEKIKKTVKIKGTVYGVELIGDVELAAWETNYPLPGYGNNYGTEYIVKSNYSKGWAKLEIACWNNTYATRGHGMTDSWIESQGYVRRKEAEKFIATIKEELKKAEDGTPDVAEIFDKVRDYVLEQLGEDY